MATRFKSVIALLAAVMVVATAACMVSSPEGEHFNRGFTYMESGEYENAIQEFDKAIQLHPNYAFSYRNRGLAYANLRQYQRAIQDFDKAIQIDPNNAPAYKHRGFAYRKLGQHAEANADKTKACSLDRQYC